MIDALVIESPPSSDSTRARAIPPPPRISEEVREAARQKLGYQGPRLLPEPSTAISKTGLPLADALREMQCGVFTVDSVERYKRSVEKTSRRRKNRMQAKMRIFARNSARGKDWHAEGIEANSVAGPFAGMIAFAAVVTLISQLILDSKVLGLSILSHVGLGIATFIVAALVMEVLLQGYGIRHLIRHARYTRSQQQKAEEKLDRQGEECAELEWRTSSLENYDVAGIPESILSLALEIKGSCEAAQFSVHYTHPKAFPTVGAARQILEAEEAERRARWSDPFLQVELGAEAYFIAAWDEKGYRVARTEAGA